jgi:pteridine reductase
MKNKTALITGAAKNIGATIAKELHSVGMNVIVHYNNSATEAHELVRKLNCIRHDSAITIQANLEKKEYYAPLIDTALTFKGNIDVLINNASAFYPTSLKNLNEKQWNELININLKAPLFISQLAAKSLEENKGCIINIADIHASNPLKNYTIYCISKAGLITLTKSLAKELAPNIRVNAISPGAITWPNEMDAKTKKNIISQIILKKTGNAEDIAKTVIFLIKDAGYITGQILNVDGGTIP